MATAVVMIGAAVQAGAWWLVAFRGIEVWRITVPVLGLLGAAALLAGPPPWSPSVEPALSAAVGVGSGAALYAATRAFAVAVRPWPAFRRHSLAMYERRSDRSPAWTLALSVAVAVPGEELFWRGLVQHDVVGGPAPVAALVAWLGYVAVNLPSVNLAAMAGAVVGGSLWGGLSWWSGGVLAPLLSHVVWTALMITLPVVRAEPA